MAGEQGYVLHEVGWPQDVRILHATLLAKWLHFVLWDRARHERRNVLPPSFDGTALAYLVGSGVGTDDIEQGLHDLEGVGLIARCPCGCGAIWVKGVQEHHQKTKSWKDGTPSNEIEPDRKTSNPNDPRCRCWVGVGLGSGEGGIAHPEGERCHVDHLDWQEWWNTMARELGMPILRDMTDKRRRFLRLKLREPSFSDRAELEAAIREQPFLHGDNQRGWRLTFDALIERKDLAQKVIERQYLNGKKKSSGVRETAKRLAEEEIAKARLAKDEKEFPA